MKDSGAWRSDLQDFFHRKSSLHEELEPEEPQDIPGPRSLVTRDLTPREDKQETVVGSAAAILTRSGDTACEMNKDEGDVDIDDDIEEHDDGEGDNDAEGDGPVQDRRAKRENRHWRRSERNPGGSQNERGFLDRPRRELDLGKGGATKSHTIPNGYAPSSNDDEESADDNQGGFRGSQTLKSRLRVRWAADSPPPPRRTARSSTEFDIRTISHLRSLGMPIIQAAEQAHESEAQSHYRQAIPRHDERAHRRSTSGSGFLGIARAPTDSLLSAWDLPVPGTAPAELPRARSADPGELRQLRDAAADAHEDSPEGSEIGTPEELPDKEEESAAEDTPPEKPAEPKERDIVAFLRKLELLDLLPKLETRKPDIAMADLADMTVEEMRGLGLPLGDCLYIQEYIPEWRASQAT